VKVLEICVEEKALLSEEGKVDSNGKGGDGGKRSGQGGHKLRLQSPSGGAQQKPGKGRKGGGGFNDFGMFAGFEIKGSTNYVDEKGSSAPRVTNSVAWFGMLKYPPT